jgi:hypothetical protein
MAYNAEVQRKWREAQSQEIRDDVQEYRKKI